MSALCNGLHIAGSEQVSLACVPKQPFVIGCAAGYEEHCVIGSSALTCRLQPLKSLNVAGLPDNEQDFALA